jgi:K+-sensing histidine kinase KdpD
MSSRARRLAEIDGEGAVWGGAGFLASLVVGVALSPFRASIGLENVVIVYLAVVAVAGAIGGRAAGLVSALSAALSYDFFFTTPYNTLKIDSADQVITVVLLFAGGLLASLAGRVGRRAGVQAREEADAIWLLQAVSQAAASGPRADQVAAEGLLGLLGARSVLVVRPGGGRDHVVARSGEDAGPLDPAVLPHLDQDGRIPSGHLRSVGGTLVLPAEGTAIDLVRDGHRVGTLVILPAADRPLLRTTRAAIAAVAHTLALADGPGCALSP